MTIENPHDKFFKELISNKENAMDFINGTFPQNILDQLNIESIRLDNNSYIDDELKETFADIVYDCKTSYIKTKEVKISLLFEHKSTSVSYPHFQLLRYMLNIWNSQINNKSSLQIVIPVIFYHGKDKWQAKQFLDYFDNMNKNLNHFLPSFEYILTDLAKYDEKAIRGEMFKRDLNKISMLIMKYISNSDYLGKNLSYILEIGKDFFRTKRGLDQLKPIIIYLLNNENITSQMVINSAKIISKKGGKIAMTAADVLRKEGLEEGLEQGSNQKAIETAKKMLDRNFDLKEIIEITGLTKEVIKGL